VITDIIGVSGRRMIEAMIKGVKSSVKLAESPITGSRQALTAAINGSFSMLASASPEDGDPDAWNACGWHREKAASACLSFPPCSSSLR